MRKHDVICGQLTFMYLTVICNISFIQPDASN